MANSHSANTFYADSTGSLTTDTNLKVTSIIYTSSNATDAVEIRETSSGPTKLILKNGLANVSSPIHFWTEPMLFSQGIYINSISSGSSVVIVTRS